MIPIQRILLAFLALAPAAGAALAGDIFDRASFARELPPPHEIVDFERRAIVDDIYHYRIILAVGAGDLDRLGIHRVVRERAPFQPIHTAQAILLAHGGRTGFVGTFLSSVSSVDADPAHHLPVHLATRDVDVWGLDFRWALVPADTTDLSPLADWGMRRDAEDLGLALAVARSSRQLATSVGGGKLDLLGFSWGVRVAYAYLDSEAELPEAERLVDRFIALEGFFKLTDEKLRQRACERIDVLQAEIDRGNLATNNYRLGALVQRARTMPDEPSSVVPGLNNWQAALSFAARRREVGLVEMHAFAGSPAGDLPTGLRFMDASSGFDLLSSASGYLPLAGARDLMIVTCDDGRSELDDHLAEITVPVLYIGAAGGFGAAGLDTFSHLGSDELASLLIALEPPGQEHIDVGHVDILQMRDAARRVWQPIYEWVMAP